MDRRPRSEFTIFANCGMYGSSLMNVVSMTSLPVGSLFSKSQTSIQSQGLAVVHQVRTNNIILLLISQLSVSDGSGRLIWAP